MKRKWLRIKKYLRKQNLKNLMISIKVKSMTLVSRYNDIFQKKEKKELTHALSSPQD